jgi:hypothetical protein
VSLVPPFCKPLTAALIPSLFRSALHPPRRLHLCCCYKLRAPHCELNGSKEFRGVAACNERLLNSHCSTLLQSFKTANYGPQAPHIRDISRRFGNVIGAGDMAAYKAWELVYDFKTASSIT